MNDNKRVIGRNDTGLVHIYCGNGKGKTTTGMGLCVRAAGYGYPVLIYQFMKDNGTSERKILEQVPNIKIVDGPDKIKFSFAMTEEEKKQERIFNDEQFERVTQMAVQGNYRVLFMDETVYAIRAGLLDEDKVLQFLKNKPEDLEVILTGQDPSDRLIEAADYVSEIRKIRHPFDDGVPARVGIER
ncbi:MAG: cob(I)yrinic acid a,c-diamide adenosyltransferase [Lachnospiraceae bacterium]|nr:cob(I)yrinic acid a,c-diamide adenosyltransferase [Lachnospiraceae bacterium]